MPRRSSGGFNAKESLPYLVPAWETLNSGCCGVLSCPELSRWHSEVRESCPRLARLDAHSLPRVNYQGILSKENPVNVRLPVAAGHGKRTK